MSDVLTLGALPVTAPTLIHRAHIVEAPGERRDYEPALRYAMGDRFDGIASPACLARLRTEMGQVSHDQVNAAVKRRLQTDNLVIAVVTQGASALADALAGDSPRLINHATPRPPEVLTEDNEIAEYPPKVARENIRIVPVSETLQR